MTAKELRELLATVPDETPILYYYGEYDTLYDAKVGKEQVTPDPNPDENDRSFHFYPQATSTTPILAVVIR